MNTLHATGPCALSTSKLVWIRINRILAWTLLTAPAMQWAVHMALETAFWMDLGLLFAHALLSLALFGKPETKSRRFSMVMHVMGFRPRDLSERNRFLLSGYRIALTFAPITVMVTKCVPLAFIAGPLFFYPVLRMGVSIIQHMFCAVTTATRRWGLTAGADLAGTLAVVFNVAMTLAHLNR